MNELTVISGFIFIFGAVVGSFLNVCIVRLPHEKSIVTPRSHCVHCKKLIAWYDNVPFLSYIMLGGKCRHCKSKISPRYFLVELVTGITFLFFFHFYGFDILLLPYLIMACGFIVATFVDFEHRIIPDEISVGGLWVGILLSCFIPAMHQEMPNELDLGRNVMRVIFGLCVLTNIVISFRTKEEKGEELDHDGKYLYIFLISAVLIDLVIDLGESYLSSFRFDFIRPYIYSLDASIVGFMLGGSLIYGMGQLGDVLFKKESMGGGDVKLLAMIGAFVGWKLSVLTFFIAPFFGAVFGIIEKIRTKDTAIAYGPFLVLGALISLFYGDIIIGWVMRGYGLY